MKYPIRVSRLDVRHKPIRYVILHHTWCQYDIPQLEMDSPKNQFDYLFNQIMEKKIADINYHAVISRIKNNYIAMLARPYVAKCDFPDIDDQYNERAIHIALLGNYDLDIPDKRAYEIMVYRVINPFVKLFSLSPSRVFLHNELTNDENENCPGDFFSKRVVVTYMRRFMMR